MYLIWNASDSLYYYCSLLFWEQSAATYCGEEWAEWIQRGEEERWVLVHKKESWKNDRRGHELYHLATELAKTNPLTLKSLMTQASIFSGIWQTRQDNIYRYKRIVWDRFNTSSMTWRGCVTIFELETCLYASSVSKPYIREKKFLNFSKRRIFFNSLLFSGKTAFLQISADFVIGFLKLLFHLKVL